jgi:glucosamine--fructose-6-phosphate aminotransferase (isomerizing)
VIAVNTAPKIIEGPYFADLMAQPRALGATLAWLGEAGRWDAVRRFVTARPWRRIVLTGMGSSYHTLHPINLTLIEAGLNPVMMETSELVHYGTPLLDEQTLIVAVSQSGGSAETVRLLELNRRAQILGVTNTASSPLAQRAELALLSQAGPEHSVSCKTYVANMLTLQWLGAVLSGREEGQCLTPLQPVSDLVAQYLQGWRENSDILAEKLRGIRHLFLTGRGSSLSAVGTGALIIKEAARVHAEGMSSAAFRHGPIEMLRADMFIGVFSGDGRTQALNHRLARDLLARGAHCYEIGTDASLSAFRVTECAAPLRPILEILPVQVMTLALAGLFGREAGHFEQATKITGTE